MRTLAVVVLSTLLASGCNFGLASESDGADGSSGTDVPDAQAGESGNDAALPATTAHLAGQLYGIDPATMTVTEPPGLDAIFDQVLTRDVLVYVENETSASLQLDVALAGTSGRQDPCEAVRRFPAGDWSENPVFDVGPGELVTSFGGHPASFRSMVLTGVFGEDGTSWTEGTLSAQLDTRELAAALSNQGDLCGLVEGLGGSCEACDDGADKCFALSITGMEGDVVDATFDPAQDGSSCAD